MLPALLIFYRPCLSSQFFITDTLSIWLKFWSVFFASSMNILVFGAPTECWLLHNRPLILGPASNGHGLYCHSSCFGYCLCYIIIGNFCPFTIFVSLSDCYCILLHICLVLSSWFAETAFLSVSNIFVLESAYVRLLTPCSTSWLIEDNTDVCLYVYIYCYVQIITIYSKCMCLYI